MRFNKKQIVKALVTARRALKTEERPAAKVASVLNPYMGCSEIEGSSGEEHEDLRSGIFATLGDAYRCEGNIQLAAKWYRRASQLSTGQHARVYAYVVCKHQLVEFYDDALKVLQDDQRRWAAKPFTSRLRRWIHSLTHADERQVARSVKGNLKFLQQHTPVQQAPQAQQQQQEEQASLIFGGRTGP